MEHRTLNNAVFSENVRCSDKLTAFFVNHLNFIYCAKSHLQERLPEIRIHEHFSDLTNVITTTLIDVEKQISRMEEIYLLLEARPGFANCQEVLELIEGTFNAIYQESADPEMRDLSILFYLQNIESIEVASFKMLNITAPKLNKQQIKQLLLENFDQTSEYLALLQHISADYLK